MKRFLAALVLLLVVGTVAWTLWHRNDVTSTPATTASTEKSLPPNSVLQVRPQPAPAATSPPASTPLPAFARPKVSDDLAQYRAGKKFADLYARLQAKPDTAESLYIKAAIYARCSVRAKSGAKPTPEERATKRVQFIAALAPGSPDQQQRIDAYDRMAVDPCDGLDLGVYDANALQRMLTAAADAGDVSAHAWLLADQAEHRTPAELGMLTHGNSMTAANLDQIRAVLASGDPDAIMFLRGTLSSTLEQGELRLDGQSFDPGAMHTALQLLACDAGAECGPDSQALLQACAMRGQCSAFNLYDYAYYYGESPNQSQLVDAYRQAFSRMLTSGDFSGFALSPVQPFTDYGTTHYGDSRP